MSKTKKIIIWVVGIGVVIFGGLYGLGYGLMKYDEYKVTRTLGNMNKFAEEQRKLAMADTVGGKTPEETLDMFIKAVQAGDYELASKYFVIPRQGEWKDQLDKIKQSDKLNKFLPPIIEASKNKGEYSSSGKSYSIEKPVGIDFFLYPNGIWKINEI